MRKFIVLVISGFILSCQPRENTIKNHTSLSAEEKVDSTNIKQFFNSALTQGKSYEWLRDLTQNIGGRLSGSPEAQKAVEWGEKVMKEVGLDSVWLQPVMVPHWVRGKKEEAYYTVNGTKKEVPICALGFSVATPKNGIRAEVIEGNYSAKSVELLTFFGYFSTLFFLNFRKGKVLLTLVNNNLITLCWCFLKVVI